jgi:hypothetical protein
MLPYTQEAEWVHVSELYHAQKHNLLEICLEKKFNSEEKIQQKWDALRPNIIAKRRFEKLVYSTMRTRSSRCAFMEDIPDSLSKIQLQKYMDLGYDWIQRIRFRHVGSHVFGVCDAVIRTSFLQTLLVPNTPPLTITGEYVLVVLQPSFQSFCANLQQQALLRYFAEGEPRIAQDAIVVVRKDLQPLVYPVDRDETIVEPIRRIRRLKRLSPLLDLDEELPIQLWPNMKQGSTAWSPERWDIAFRLGEITMLWVCDDRHRQKALEQGVSSWRDPRFTPELVGFTETKAEILFRIVEINRHPTEWLYVEKDNLEASFPELQDSTLRHLFVDFEYFIDDHFIYLIGVWDASKKEYRAFWAKERTAEAWENMWKSFCAYLESTPSHCWYWYAEKKMMEKTGAPLENLDETWTDLWGVCRAGVAVRGAFDFSLKSFVKAFHQHGKMPFSYADLEECQDGLASIGVAQKYFATREERLKHTLEKYNRYDCEAMAHIWEAIRTTLS